MTQTAEKQQQVLTSQTTTQKVFGAVPIAEPWDKSKIVGELRRVGIGIDSFVDQWKSEEAKGVA